MTSLTGVRRGVRTPLGFLATVPVSSLDPEPS